MGPVYAREIGFDESNLYIRNCLVFNIEPRTLNVVQKGGPRRRSLPGIALGLFPLAFLCNIIAI
jgi:hypothetical protein